MKIKDLFLEGPVRQLKNATLAAKYHVDSAELQVQAAIRALENQLNDPKGHPTGVEEAVTHLRDARKEMRRLKNLFKRKEI